MGESTDPADLLAVAVEVARAAATLARDRRADGVSGVATKSTDTDLVTAADRAVEALILELLRDRRPGDQMMGEESGSHGTGTGAVRWVVDPIDGTVNYVYGLPQYAVSIAAEVRGTAVAGVVLNAATGAEWTATLGGGAWHAGTRLTGPTTSTIGQALVATGFGYDPARRAHQGRVVAGVLPVVRDIRRFGVASLDLCAAAAGQVDAYYEKGLNRWDHAAGGLVAAEAGLLVTGLNGQPPGPDLVLAAPPSIHRALHDLLVELDATGGP